MNEEYIYKYVYNIDCVAPHVQNLHVHSQLRLCECVCCIFIYSMFYLCAVSHSMAFIRIEKKREPTNEWTKNPYFFFTFIYSISNTFSDFNTSIELAAFVNEFFTSYMRFLAFGVCVFFSPLHSLSRRYCYCSYFFIYSFRVLFTSAQITFGCIRSVQ